MFDMLHGSSRSLGRREATGRQTAAETGWPMATVEDGVSAVTWSSVPPPQGTAVLWVELCWIPLKFICGSSDP